MSANVTNRGKPQAKPADHNVIDHFINKHPITSIVILFLLPGVVGMNDYAERENAAIDTASAAEIAMLRRIDLAEKYYAIAQQPCAKAAQ